MSDPQEDPPPDGPGSDDPEEVPPGRQGADSGAADAVRVDPEGTAEMPDRSHGNDIPGVGPRDPERDAGSPSFEEQLEAYRASRSGALGDETGGAPHLNERERAGPDDES